MIEKVRAPPVGTSWIPVVKRGNRARANLKNKKRSAVSYIELQIRQERGNASSLW